MIPPPKITPAKHDAVLSKIWELVQNLETLGLARHFTGNGVTAIFLRQTEIVPYLGLIHDEPLQVETGGMLQTANRVQRLAEKGE